MYSVLSAFTDSSGMSWVQSIMITKPTNVTLQGHYYNKVHAYCIVFQEYLLNNDALTDIYNVFVNRLPVVV